MVVAYRRCMSSQQTESLRSLDHSESAFRTLFRLAPDAILVVCSDGVVIEANEQPIRPQSLLRRVGEVLDR
jgi:PAS domain-containing protein